MRRTSNAQARCRVWNAAADASHDCAQRCRWREDKPNVADDKPNVADDKPNVADDKPNAADDKTNAADVKDLRSIRSHPISIEYYRTIAREYYDMITNIYICPDLG